MTKESLLSFIKSNQLPLVIEFTEQVGNSPPSLFWGDLSDGFVNYLPAVSCVYVHSNINFTFS